MIEIDTNKKVNERTTLEQHVIINDLGCSNRFYGLTITNSTQFYLQII